MKIFYLFKPVDTALMFFCVAFSPLFAVFHSAMQSWIDTTPFDIRWAIESFPRIFKLNAFLDTQLLQPYATEFLTVYINSFFLGLAFTFIVFGVRALIFAFKEVGYSDGDKYDRNVLDQWVKFMTLWLLFFLVLLIFILFAPLRDSATHKTSWSREFFLNKFELYIIFPVVNLSLYFFLLGTLKVLGCIIQVGRGRRL